MKTDEEVFGSEPFSEAEQEEFGINPVEPYSRYIRRVAKEARIYIDLIIQDIANKFSNEDLELYAKREKRISSLDEYIDQRAADCMFNMKMKIGVKKPFEAVVFASMKMAEKDRDWPAHAFAVRMIDTHSIVARYKGGNKEYKQELINRKILSENK